MNPVYLAPGPAQLYFTVADHLKQALREGIPSLSHRSKKFQSIYLSAKENLYGLLNIPAHFHLFFLGSATEAWERIIENLVVDDCYHVVNGAFSERFFQTARQLDRKAVAWELAPGQGYNKIPALATPTELIAVTHNETSTGVSITPITIANIKKAYPQTLLAVDAVSSLPYPDFDYEYIDSIFFSVQKGFGLPAGLGVWLVNDKCLQKSEEVLASRKTTGSYHALQSLYQFSLKHQTPETPNTLGIYLLSKVCADMQRRGIQSIRRETDYKAALLYQTLQRGTEYQPFVKDTAYQSRTVIVGSFPHAAEEAAKFLEDHGLLAGEGYGPFRKEHLRFANFPTHSKEQFELLVDTLEKWRN